jgi:hypothetical protein
VRIDMDSADDEIKVGDAVEWRGQRYIAVLYERYSWFFQPAKKDGTANKGRSLQRLIGYKKIEPRATDGPIPTDPLEPKP